MRAVRRVLGVGACSLIWACGSSQGATPASGPSGTGDNDGTHGTDGATGSGPAGGEPDGSGSSGASGPSSSGSQGPNGATDASGSGAVDAASLTDAGGASDGGPAQHMDASTGTADGGGGTTKTCKRGVAANAAPGSPFSPSAAQPGVSWWYDWSTSGSGQGAGIQFVPMIWGSGSLKSTLPAGSAYVLGFNEPNFKSQSDLSPAQAAADWPSVEAAAKATGALLVSPAVNYCGSASSSSGCTVSTVTDPYTYLKDFFAACSGCEVDYVAVHWYNCDLPSLQGYIEGNEDAGGGLQGFVQFGKPIWLTEFSCDGSHSAADQKAYMEAAVPWLENDPHVFRYSWFSASNIASALLANSDGSLTDLGQTYVSLAQSCGP